MEWQCCNKSATKSATNIFDVASLQLWKPLKQLRMTKGKGHAVLFQKLPTRMEKRCLQSTTKQHWRLQRSQLEWRSSLQSTT
jgi:hypothetical protein